MLILNQVLSFVSPLIVKEILDEHIIGIEKTWYEVKSPDSKSAYFNGKYYKQERNFDEDEANFDFDHANVASVFMYNNHFYFVEAIIEDGVKDLEGSTLVVTKDDTSYIYDNVIQLRPENVSAFYSPSIQTLTILIGLLFGRAILSIIVSYIQRISTEKTNVTIIRAARLEAAKKLTRLPMSYFEAEPAGKTSARITHDVNGLMDLYRAVVNIVLYAGLSFIFAYVGMFYLDYRLALISFLFYPLILIWIKFFSKRLNKIATKVNEFSSLIVATINEIINGISILQIFNYKKQTIENFDELSQSYMDEQLNEVKLHTTLGWNMINLIRGLVTALIVLYFGWNYLSGTGMLISAGLIYAYNEYILKLIEPIGILFREVSGFEHSLVRTERIFKIIDGELEDDSKIMIPPFKGDIKFDNVWFSYKKDEYVLKGVSVNIPRNTMLGIVGHTGSGKSTMMNLLMRFNDLKDEDMGSITVDGISIDHYSKRTYREHIGIILQDPVLFKGTLADNIRFGKENVSDEELERVLISVGGGHILDRYPNRINHEISRKGTNLSLGEKQIVSFARALVHNPSILIMDEATANIDTETETMIQNALNVVSKNRTTIVIAHRLSTIKNADKIIVLDKGRKVEEGTHTELLKLNGYYANIYRAQVADINR
jgi:ATP-binding cassette subfamily B protein